MICGLGRGTQQGKTQALPCRLYENAQAAAPTAPPSFTHSGSSYGLPFFLFYIIIRRKKEGGRAEAIAAAHLCGSSISLPEQLPYFIKIEGIDVASLKNDRTLAVCKGKPQLPLLAV